MARLTDLVQQEGENFCLWTDGFKTPLRGKQSIRGMIPHDLLKCKSAAKDRVTNYLGCYKGLENR